MEKNFDKVKDSGARQEFDTGSKRDTSIGKGSPELIPVHATRRLARHYENGSAKYGDDNWRLGQPMRRYLSSAYRHLLATLAGETDEDHAIAVAWNMFAYVQTEYEIDNGNLPESLRYIEWDMDKLRERMAEKEVNNKIGELGKDSPTEFTKEEQSEYEVEITWKKIGAVSGRFDSSKPNITNNLTINHDTDIDNFACCGIGDEHGNCPSSQEYRDNISRHELDNFCPCGNFNCQSHTQ